jgi:hypothetical protein
MIGSALQRTDCRRGSTLGSVYFHFHATRIDGTLVSLVSGHRVFALPKMSWMA